MELKNKTEAQKLVIPTVDVLNITKLELPVISSDNVSIPSNPVRDVEVLRKENVMLQRQLYEERRKLNLMLDFQNEVATKYFTVINEEKPLLHPLTSIIRPIKKWMGYIKKKVRSLFRLVSDKFDT